VLVIVYMGIVLCVLPVAHLIYVELRRVVRRYRVRRLMRRQR
jgi:hypothetical protein